MNGAMVPVTPAEHVKMTVKSGKAPEDSVLSHRCFHHLVIRFHRGSNKNMLFFVNNLQNKRDVFVLGDAFGPQVPMKNEGFRP